MGRTDRFRRPALFGAAAAVITGALYLLGGNGPLESLAIALVWGLVIAGLQFLLQRRRR